MSKMESKISVVIPVYNRADWIEKTINFILKQKDTVDEIVICDDGSTDELADVLKPYLGQIRLIKIENSGPGAARKKAIEETSNDWVALCDSDDYWLPDHITKFRFALKKFPKLNFYFSNFNQSDVAEKSKFGDAPPGWREVVAHDNEIGEFIYCGDNLYRGLLQFQCCFPSACIFRKDLYEKIGGIDPAISRWPSEDAHLTRRLAAYGRAVICQSATVLINKHDENFSKSHIFNFEGRLKILEKLISDCGIPPANIRETQDELGISRLHLFRLYFWDKQYRKAALFFRQELRWKGGGKDYIRFLCCLLLAVPKAKRTTFK